MKISKLRPVLCAPRVNKSFIRSVTATANCARNIEGLKSYDEIPGLSKLPIIGRLHHFLPGGDMAKTSMIEVGLAMYEKYGPIVRFGGFLGRPDIVMLFDADSIEQILRTEDRGIPTRHGFASLNYYRKKTKGSDVPNGLVNDQGEKWQMFRKAVNPIMMQPKTIKLYSDALDEIAQDVMRRYEKKQNGLQSLRGPNNTLKIDLGHEINLWSMESVGLVALGRRLNCLSLDLPDNSPEKRLIKLAHDIFKIMNELDFKTSVWKYYPTKNFKKAMKLYAEQEDLADFFIQKTIDEVKEKNENKSDDQKSVLEQLLKVNKEVAVIMACDMLLAGVDTTSNSMIATLYLLAINQDKQDKLREEITSRREKRPYMRACIKEAHRMMPVVIGNARTTSKDYGILGYHIPKNTRITFMHQVMSRFEKYYPRPNEYIPERWTTTIDDPLYHKHAHPFASNPFGFGVRSCIGRRLAELEMETFLPRIIENFKVEWAGPPMKVSISLINTPVGPFNFVLKDI